MKGNWILISVLILLSSITLIGFMINGQLWVLARQSESKNDALIRQLETKIETQKANYQQELTKARQTQWEDREIDIIYGYIVGYLAANKRLDLITNELPEFAILTVQYAREFGVSPYECLAICQVENGFNLHQPGKKGEQGPAQIMIGRWNDYFKRFGYQPADFYKWQCNYRVGIAHFAELLKRNNNNLAAAIGEYNGGGKWADISSSRNHVRKFEYASRGISRLRIKRRGI